MLFQIDRKVSEPSHSTDVINRPSSIGDEKRCRVFAIIQTYLTRIGWDQFENV